MADVTLHLKLDTSEIRKCLEDLQLLAFNIHDRQKLQQIVQEHLGIDPTYWVLAKVTDDLRVLPSDQLVALLDKLRHLT